MISQGQWYRPHLGFLKDNDIDLTYGFSGIMIQTSTYGFSRTVMETSPVISQGQWYRPHLWFLKDSDIDLTYDFSRTVVQTSPMIFQGQWYRPQPMVFKRKGIQTSPVISQGQWNRLYLWPGPLARQTRGRKTWTRSRRFCLPHPHNPAGCYPGWWLWRRWHQWQSAPADQC